MAAMPASGTQAYGPGPHEINNHLIESVHRAIVAHPSAAAKATYGKILASLLAHQQAAHSADAGATQHGLQGGPQTDTGGAPGEQPGQVIQTLTGGPGGGPTYYGQPMPPTPNPVVAALVAAMAHPNAGAVHMAGPQESGLLGSVLAQHVPLVHWA